jgi:hypothetical protein
MTIILNNYLSDMIFQRDTSNTKNIKMTGSYDGVTSLEFKIIKNGSTVIQNWTSLTSVNAIECTFEANYTFNTGGWYQFIVRYLNNSSSEVTSSQFAIGAQVYMIGQSNCTQLATDGLTGVNINNPLHRVFLGITLNNCTVANIIEQFIQTISPGLSAILNTANISNSSVPIALIVCPTNGSFLYQWNEISQNTPYGVFEYYFYKLGGDAEFIYFLQGEADVGSGTTQSIYESMLSTLQTRLRNLCNRGVGEQHFLGSQIAATINGNSPAIIQAAQSHYYNNTQGATYCGTLVGQSTYDGVHLQPGTPTANVGNAVGSIVGYFL